MRTFISFIDTVWGENRLLLKFVPALTGAFAKLRNATAGFVVTVCVSARRHGKSRSPQDAFSYNLIFEDF